MRKHRRLIEIMPVPQPLRMPEHIAGMRKGLALPQTQNHHAPVPAWNRR